MPLDWDDDTKISANDDFSRPAIRDKDRAYLIVLAGQNVGEMYKIAQASTVIGRGTQCDIHVTDDGISRRHAEIRMHDGRITIHDLGSTNGTWCNGDRIDEHELQDGDKIQVGSTTILKFTFHDSLDENFQRQMYESALRDGLTKAFNKKYFLDRLESEFAFSTRHGSPLSLILFDIDHFKAVNDTHGHLAGDHVLVTLAGLVQQAIRQEDVFARYGGEEFAVICRGVDLAGAASFGERVRRMVAAHNVKYEQIELQITLSLGVATVDGSMKGPAELIARADHALYDAKRAGRNRLVAAQ